MKSKQWQKKHCPRVSETEVFAIVHVVQLFYWSHVDWQSQTGKDSVDQILSVSYWYQADVSWCHDESWFEKKLFHLWASRADYWWWECRLRKPVPGHHNLNIRLLQDWTEESPRGTKIDDWELLNRSSFSCPGGTASQVSLVFWNWLLMRATEWFQRIAAYNKIDEEKYDQQKDKFIKKIQRHWQKWWKQILFIVDEDKKNFI